MACLEKFTNNEKSFLILKDSVSKSLFEAVESTDSAALDFKNKLFDSLQLYDLNSSSELNTLSEMLNSVFQDSDIAETFDILNLDSNQFYTELNSEIVNRISKLSALNKKIKEKNINEVNVDNKTFDIKLDDVIAYENDSVYESVYKNVPVVKSYFDNVFSTELLKKILFNFDSNVLVTNIKLVNENIANYKNELFNNLVEYINEVNTLNGITSEPISNNYFINGEPSITKLLETIEQAKPIIDKITDLELQTAYNSRFGNSDSMSNMMLKAHMAYHTLRDNNFDNIFSEIFGSMFQVDEKFPNEVGVDKIKYDYSIKSSMRSTWRTNEFTDVVDELGKMSKIIIQQIPLIINGKDSRTTVKLEQFLGSLNKLKDNKILKVLGDDYLMSNSIRSANSEYMTRLLKAVINYNSSNGALPGLNKTDFQVFNSVYEFMYNKSNPSSIYNLLYNTHNNSKIINDYNVLDNITSVIDNTMSVNYRRYIEDTDTGFIVGQRVSNEKNSLNKRLFENAVAGSTKSRSDKSELLNKLKYKFSDTSFQRFSMKIGTITYEIRFDDTKQTMAIYNGVKSVRPEAVMTKVSDEKLIDMYINNSSDVTLNYKEKAYLEYIKNISDIIGINYLTRNNINKFIVARDVDTTTSFEYRDLAGIAFNNLRNIAAYDLYERSGADRTIIDFLQDDTIYDNEVKFDGADAETLTKLRNKLGLKELKYTIYNQSTNTLRVIDKSNINAINKISVAEDVVNGTVYSNVVKDGNRNNIPNNRIANITSLLDHYINTRIKKSPDAAMKNNIFATPKGRDLLTDVEIKLEAKIGNNYKNSSKFNLKEFIHSMFYNDFLKDFASNSNSLRFLPMTISDKKYFLTTVIDANKTLEYNTPSGKKESVVFKNATSEQLINLINDSIGDYYRRYSHNLKEDYIKIMLHNNNLLNSLNDELSKVIVLSDVAKVTADFKNMVVNLDNMTISIKSSEPSANQLDFIKSIGAKKLYGNVYRLEESMLPTLEIDFYNLANNNNEARIENINKAINAVNKLQLTYDTLNTTLADNILHNERVLANNASMDVLEIQQTNSELLKDTSFDVLDSINLKEFDDVIRYTPIRLLENIAYENEIDVINDIHFTNKNGIRGVSNQLMYLTENLYTNNGNNTELNNYFKNNIAKFTYDLLDNDIKIDLISKENENIKSLLNKMNAGEFIDSRTGYMSMALYEDNDGKLHNISSIKINDNNHLMLKDPDYVKRVKFNPIIEKFVLMNYFIGKNYRNLIGGTELAYPTKKSGSTYTPNFQNFELEQSIQDLAQSKRLAIVAAPINQITYGSIVGPSKEMSVAIISDIEASVFNFQGLQTNIESHDGAAWANGASNYLENNALHDNAVGDTKKNIGSNNNIRYNNEELLKFAVFSITNEMLRTSTGSEADFNRIFKKMNDISWDRLNTEIDLTKNFKGEKLNLIDFTENSPIYTEANVKIIANDDTNTFTVVDDFNKIFNGWLTDSNANGNYFAQNSRLKYLRIDNLFTTDSILNDTTLSAEIKNSLINEINNNGANYVVKYYGSSKSGISGNIPLYRAVNINSNYDLYNVLGGNKSMSVIDGQLRYGERSMKIWSDYMNNVGTIKDNYVKGDVYTQDNVYQPLKDPSVYISYLSNLSSFKTGQKNMNSSKLFFNDEPFKTARFNMDAIGIQLNSEKTAEKGGHVTQPSQVISAITANGYTLDIAKKIYNNLAAVSRNSIRNIANAVYNMYKDEFVSGIKSKEDLYNLSIKQVLNGIKTDDNVFGLKEGIVSILNEEYDNMISRGMKVSDSSFKAPFSDASLYQKSTIDFTSMVNSVAIKGQFSGLGSVLNPSYKMLQLYRLGDETLTHDDLKLKNSELINNKELFKSIMDNPNFIYTNLKDLSFEELLARGLTTDEFLNAKQVESLLEYGYRDISELEPETAIYVSKKEYDSLIDNGSISGDLEYENTKIDYVGFVPIIVDSFEKYIAVKNNFEGFYDAPSIPTDLRPASIVVDYMGKKFNMFDNLHVRNAFRNSQGFDVEVSPEELARAKGDKSKVLEYRVQKAFENLGKGIFELDHTLSNKYGLDSNVIDGFTLDNVKNEAAEIIMPKLYRNLFGLDSDTTLYQALNNSFVITNFVKTLNYDVSFLRENGNNLLVNYEGSGYSDALVPKKITRNRLSKIGNNLYKTNEYGEPLYKIGMFINNNYVSNITEMLDNSTGETVFVVKDNNALKELLNHESTYSGIKLNPKKTNTIDLTIKKLLELSTKLNDDNFDTYFTDNLVYEKDGTINAKKSHYKMSNYFSNKNYSFLKREASFLRSLDILSPRIPSQAMQTFMKMKTAAFLNKDSNDIYVSRWQTWLQGSDYDIDKSFLIGTELDSNGVYQGWSPFFNNNSYELIKLSEQLPVPNAKTYKIDNIKGLDVTDFINEYYHLNSDEGDVKYYTRLFDAVNEYDSIKYDPSKVSLEQATDILDIINEHNQYFLDKYDTNGNLLKGSINKRDMEKALKNSVSSGLMDVVQHYKNLNQSFIPIDVGLIGKHAPKISKDMTYANPATQSKITSLNMDGQDGISISATASKVYYALTYYFNNILQNGTPEEISKLPFLNNYEAFGENAKMFLSNINWSAISDDNKNIFIKSLERKYNVPREDIIKMMVSDTYLQKSDSMISSMISSSTDNAKELILSVLNAGPKTMGMYLHAMMLGYDFANIVDFMTRNKTVKSLIENSNKNGFENNFNDSESLKLSHLELENGPLAYSNEIIQLFKNILNNVKDLPNIAKTYFDNKNKNKKVNTSSDNIDPASDYDVKELLKYLFSVSRADNNNYILEFIKDVDYNNPDLMIGNKIGYNINREIDKISKLLSYDYDADDASKFMKLYDDAKDTKFLGTILGTNQGVKTLVSERISFIKSINNHMSEKMDDYLNKVNKTKKPSEQLDIDSVLSIMNLSQNEINEIERLNIHKNFDFIEFLNEDNKKYRNLTIKLYDNLKSSFNIFDVITKLPHYNEMLNVLRVTHLKSMSESFKYRATYELSNRKYYLKGEENIRKIENFIDDVIINEWLSNEDISIKIPKDSVTLNEQYSFEKTQTDSNINLSNEFDRAKFKVWFERDFIVNLKNGKYDSSSYDISTNDFISDLVINIGKNSSANGTMEYYKLPIDMTVDKTESDRAAFGIYKLKFNEIKDIKIHDGRTIGELFFLYNTIVNKNKYGQDRLTRMFSDFNHDDSSMIYRYINYIGKDLDYDNSIVSLNKYFEKIDIVTAPIPLSDYDAKRYNIYKQYDKENKVFKYHANDATVNSNINDYNNTGLSQMQIYNKNNFLTLRNTSDTYVNLNNIFESDSISSSTLASAIESLIKTNSINFKINC